MRTILTTVLALTLVAGFGGQAGATTYKTKYKSHSAHYKYDRPRPRWRQSAGFGPPAYQERLIESAPFGSRLWWELMNPPVAGR